VRAAVRPAEPTRGDRSAVTLAEHPKISRLIDPADRTSQAEIRATGVLRGARPL